MNICILKITQIPRKDNSHLLIFPKCFFNHRFIRLYQNILLIHPDISDNAETKDLI